MRALSQKGQYLQDDWVEKLQRLEKLGYSSFLVSDHLNNQWESVATLAAVAAVTRHLKIGSLVMNVGLRHPAVLAQAAATIHLISRGRLEFGIGAGWVKTEYEQAGIDYDSPALRIERLEETLTAIRSMWTQDTTTFTGKHVRLSNIASPTPLPKGDRPRIMVGGGGRRLLSVAGRHADIVSIVPSWPKGRILNDSTSDQTPAKIREKAQWVMESAESIGRNPDEIELSTFHWRLKMTKNRDEALREYSRTFGISFAALSQTPFFLVGTPEEMCERILQLHEDAGLTYFVIPGSMDEFGTMEEFSASVIRPILGR